MRLRSMLFVPADSERPFGPKRLDFTILWGLFPPDKIDIVDIFRRPEFVEEVVDQAIQLKVPAIWMQEDVIHEKAAEKARRAGIFVVMDLCILKEHRARLR